MEECWVVRNNTKSVLILPKNGLRFNSFGQEKDLCFFTNKTISELERDPEIALNFTHNNIVTVTKTTPEIKKNEEIQSQIKELRDLIINSQKIQEPSQNIDISQIAKAISDNINIKVSGVTKQEDVVSYKEEEKMQEEALKNLIFKKGKNDAPKKLEGFGTDKEVENESDGNEDLLGDLGL